MTDSQETVTREPSATSSVRKQVRGSALLLMGRACAILMNLATQVVIIRALARTEYGHLAYALSLVEMLSVVAVLCMDKTFSRFGAIYHERRERVRFAGALVLSLVTPLVLGGIVATGLILGGAWTKQFLSLDDAAWPLLFAIVWLIPANGVCSVAQSLMTVARGPRDVFFRRHLLGPALKLAIITGVAVMGGGAQEFALALLAVGLGGLVADFWFIGRILSAEGLWPAVLSRTPDWSPRDMLGTGLPLLVTDAAMLARGTLVVVLLGWIGSSSETAAFRAALSMVKVNELVIINFAVMFVPLASRLFAEGATESLWDTHRRTNLWIMVLSFPVFAATVAWSQPLTILMFGSAYADAASLLVILACGYFVQAVYGFHGQLLRVLGQNRAIVVAEIVTVLVTILAAVLLIHTFGAIGAACATAVGIVLQSGLKSWASQKLSLTAPNDEFRNLRAMTLAVAVMVVGLALVIPPGWLAGGLLTLGSSAVVWLLNRSALNAGEMFPEFQRIARLLTFLPTKQAVGEATSSEGAPRLAYIMSRFPKLTETFVLREMIEMERLGADVRVFPLQRERTKVIHPEAADFVARACFTPWLSPAIFAANLRTFRNQPDRYLATFGTLLRTNFGSLRFLSGAIGFFPKVVYLGERMRHEKIDHVHAHFASHPAMAAWVIQQLFGIPYSFTAHGSDLHRDRHMLRKKVDAALTVITISDYNRRLIVEECGVAVRDKVHVIHCGIDPRLFTPRTEPTPFEQGLRPFRMICIGTLHEVKGQQYLLQACRHLFDRGWNFRCLLVGDGPDRRRLTQLAEDLGLTNVVEFCGKQTAGEIQQLLRETDVIVAPSVPTKDGRREGIPVVLMEGMGSGLAAVASDLSGIPELVRHQETGLLTPPRDAEALAKALSLLAGDHDLRRRLAVAGYEHVLREFLVAENTAALLRLITGEAPPSDAALPTDADGTEADLEPMEVACSR